MQTPFWQLSPVVHASPSLHVVPFGLFPPPAQMPLVGSQLPPVVHWAPEHGASPAPMQAPAALQANEANISAPLHFVVALAAVQVAPVFAV